MIFPLCLAALCAQPPGGPVALDVAGIIALAAEPWRDEAGFREALLASVPNFSEQSERHALGEHSDPFLYTIAAHFAWPPTPGLPGGVLRCARYGLETRDLFLSNGFTDPASFTLFRIADPAPDDAEVWPEAAIARLACTLAWDDSRAVEIVGIEAARRGLAVHFNEITARGDLDPVLYGESGYRLSGQGGLENTSVLVESAEITLTRGFQSLRFRAFLLNGGM